jgi:hypothetical protein
MIRLNGLLVDLDWKREPTTWGPPLSIRFSEDDALRLIEAAGLKPDAPQPNGPFHYMIVARV